MDSDLHIIDSESTSSEDINDSAAEPGLVRDLMECR